MTCVEVMKIATPPANFFTGTTFAERVAVAKHVVGCPECYAFFKRNSDAAVLTPKEELASAMLALALAAHDIADPETL